MTNTRVYTLLSHNCCLLAPQVQLLRRYVPGLTTITVVQGPFGYPAMLSGGDQALKPEIAERLGVELMTLDRGFSGAPRPVRFALIYQHLQELALGGNERFAMILHGDLFPMSQVDYEELLDGAAIAARGILPDNRRVIWPTWCLIDTENPDTQSLHHVPGDIEGEGVLKVWEAAPIFPDTKGVPKAICQLENVAEYQFEWCAPIFLHLNKIALSDAAQMQGKLRAIEQLADVTIDPESPCYTVEDVPHVKPVMQIGTSDKTPFGKKYRTSPAARRQGQLTQFAAAVKRWIEAGRPERSDQHVREIFDEYCTPCQYNRDGRCKACGCQIRGDEPALAKLLSFVGARSLTNKIRMATEHCPLWKW